MVSRRQRGSKGGPQQSRERNLVWAKRLYDAGRLAEALAIAKRVIDDQPQNAEAFVLLGDIAQADKQYFQAERFLRMALGFSPASVDALNRLGSLLRETGDLQGAEQFFRKVIAIQPDSATAYNGLGAVLANQGKYRDAASAFERALVLQPKQFALYSNLLLCLQYDETATPERRFAVAREFGRKLESSVRARSTGLQKPRVGADRPLRVGYVSPDLGMHPVGIFLSGVLSGHDSEAFQVYCYSGRVKEDEITRRLMSQSHEWRPVAGLKDDQLAALIRNDRIDILVDLNGHTGLHRLGAFAFKPAPVQASWLGYPDTTGLSAIDYVISDPVTVPPGGERYFVEEVVRLPDVRFTHQPPEYAPPVVPPPCLTKGYVTFGSFNNLTKVSESVIQIWREVLHQVPDSRLLLKWKSLSGRAERKRILQKFVDAGLDCDRLELRGAVPYRDLLKEYGDVDIALDPFPFTGGLTSCDALWQGVPVVTLAGDRPSSRQTLGFLMATGLEEFAADSRDEYVRIARQMAYNPEHLARLRSRLRPRMAASALCDTQGFARQLEAVYREMWQRWLSST